MNAETLTKWEALSGMHELMQLVVSHHRSAAKLKSMPYLINTTKNQCNTLYQYQLNLNITRLNQLTLRPRSPTSVEYLSGNFMMVS